MKQLRISMCRTAKLLTVILLSNISFVNGQDAILVDDYNPGELDGFHEWSLEKIEFLGDIYFPIQNESHGEELGILEGGQLRLFKDLLPGEASSSPSSFYVFGSLLYFTAMIEDGVSALMKTDGTPEGTVPVIDPALTPLFGAVTYVESLSGKLYFTYAGMVYSTDGTLTESHYSMKYKSLMTAYGNEIAFVEKDQFGNELTLSKVNSDGGISILEVFDSELRDIPIYFTVMGDQFFLYMQGRDGSAVIYYSMTFEEGGMASVTPDDIKSGFINLGDDTRVVMNSEGLHLLSLDEQDQATYSNIYEGTRTNSMFTYLLNGSKLMLSAEIGTDDFLKNDLILYDKDTGQSERAFKLSPHASNIVGFNNYGFIADGTSNNFQPTVQYYDFKNDAKGEIHEFEQRSRLPSSIYLLGVQDGKLYFLSNLIQENGRELYYLDISELPDLSTSIEQAEISEVELKIYPDGFELVSDEKLMEYTVKIYDMQGKYLTQLIARSNQQQSVDYLKGTFILSIDLGDKQIAMSAFWSN